MNTKIPQKKFEELSKFLQIISEKNRLKILFILKDEEKCVCEIWKNLDLAQNLISSHLKILRDFKLINNRREGKNIHYSINDKTIKKYNLLFTKFLNNYEQ